MLYTLITHDCVAFQNNNSIIKFASDTIVIGLTKRGDKTAYRKEVDDLVAWYQDNLSLNVKKTKEMIIDPRRRKEQHLTLYISRMEVERVSSFRFLGVHITEDLTWSHNTTELVKILIINLI